MSACLWLFHVKNFWRLVIFFCIYLTYPLLKHGLFLLLWSLQFLIFYWEIFFPTPDVPINHCLFLHSRVYVVIFFFSTSIFRRSKLACLTQPCPFFLQGPKRVQEASLFWGFFRDRYCVQIFPSLLERSGSASVSRCVNQSKCPASVNRSVLLHTQLSPHVCMFVYHS